MKYLFLLLLAVVFPNLAVSYPLRGDAKKTVKSKDADFLLKTHQKICNLKEIANMTFDQNHTVHVIGDFTKEGAMTTWSNSTFQSREGAQQGVNSGFCLLLDVGTQTMWCEVRSLFLDGPLEGSTVVMAGLVPTPKVGGNAYFTITGGTSCFAGVTGLVKGDTDLPTRPFQFLI